MDSKLLNNIAFDIVKDKVIEDKMTDYLKEQEENLNDDKNQLIDLREEKIQQEEDLDELEKYDSEEERIMNKQKAKFQSHIEETRKKVESKKNKPYGVYNEIFEDQFLDTMLKNKKVVCHFYHTDFERCKIMDKHLKLIAAEHPETLFVKINADKTPFFTVKLSIKVLPTVILFIDGKAVDRVVGFEQLGIKDDFPTINLARKLVNSDMITANNKAEKGEINLKKSASRNKEDSDSDY